MAEPTKTELAEEISLDESLEDAREAIDKFLNNKFEEAYEIVEPKVNCQRILTSVQVCKVQSVVEVRTTE